MKYSLAYLLITFFYFTLPNHLFAQPSNDNCAGAVFLSPSSTCTPYTGTTQNATQSLPACAGVANDDVWFVFTANGPALDVVVQGTAGFNPVIQAFPGSCSNSSIGCADNTGIGAVETLSLTGLISGQNYFVRVYHSPATNPTTPNFYICVTDPVVQPPCNTSTPAGNDCSQAVLICEVDGYCGNTSASYTVNTWPQLNTAFCGSIENNSFITFVAESSTVSINVWVTSSTANNGIQILIFSTPACGGAVTSYFCQQLPFQTGVQSVSASGLTPGNSYYMMIDGFAGDVCDYTMGVNSGIQVSGSINTVGTGSTICLGNSVNLMASGGNGVYDWTPDPDLDTLAGPNVVATPTTTGIHTYSMTTNSSNTLCPNVSTASIDIDVQPIVDPNAGLDDTICLGESYQLNGAISSSSNTATWNYNASGISPTPTVNFSPNPTVLNPTVTVNQPGVYKFLLRETSSICGIVRDTMLLTVVNPTQNVSSIAPSCVGMADGTILIDNPFANEYSFDNGVTWVTDSFATNFQAGTYDVCSKTPQGCEICSSVTVVDPAPIDLIVSPDVTICENGSTTLVATASGGGTSYDYYWDIPASNTNSSQTVSPTTNSSYSVYAISNSGCISDTLSVNVAVRGPITGTISNSQMICPGDFANINSTANGGLGSPYTFSWSNGQVGTGDVDDITVNPTTNTNYTVTITDGCESSPLILSTDVEMAPFPVPMIDAPITESCEGDTFIILNSTDPALNDVSYWEISNGFTSNANDEIVFMPQEPGSYDVTLTVTSPNGCVASQTFVDFITVHPIPRADFSYSPTPLTMFNTVADFQNNSLNATNYQWTFESGIPGQSNLTDPSVAFPDGVVDEYEVTLIATSEFGCIDSIKKIIAIEPDVILYAPNTFTPDDDEFNQNWKVYIEGIDLYSFELLIYDRWGHIVFENHDPQTGWDGTLYGKLLPVGTYNWKLSARDALNDNKYEWQGFVNIIR